MYRQYQSTDVTGHSPHYVEGKYTETNGLVELSKSQTTMDVTVQAWDFKPRGKQTKTRILCIM